MISMPQRGQAISYNDLYNIIDNLNDINTKLVATTSASNFIGPSGATASPKISQAMFAAVYSAVGKPGAKRSINEKEPFTVNFGVTFKNPPVVSVTLQAGTSESGDNGNTGAAQNATVVIQKITTTSVSGVVVYNYVGNATNALHVIAIGNSN